MKANIKFVMNDLKRKLDWLNTNTDHDIIYIAAYGSMNYDMFLDIPEYKSDVDAKAIHVPSFEEIIKGTKMVSKVYTMDDGSQIDVKDIRMYIEMWKKSNPEYLEMIVTEFYIAKTEFKEIISLGDEITTINVGGLLNCIKGMQMEKYKALSHPYPNIKSEVEEYGYSRKQIHHIHRLLWFTKSLLSKIESSKTAFRDSLVLSNDSLDIALECLKYKTTFKDLGIIECEAKNFVDELKLIIDGYKDNHDLKFNDSLYKKLNNIAFNIIKDKCRTELIKDGVISYKMTDFSNILGGRYRTHGDCSGQEFYEDHLLPMFQNAILNNYTIEIDIDGTFGYPISFLDESFGKLSTVYTSDIVNKYIEFKTDDNIHIVEKIKNVINSYKS